ncbi:MAG: hypothetical protein ABIN74_05015 [Ferruginibacter sp.]
MNPLKSFFTTLIFLLIAAGFFFLIRFEIRYGIAGGKFGGVEVINMPGTFWFFIALQAFLGLSLVTNAIKELMKFRRRNIEKSDPANIIAIYWLLAASFFCIVNLLAIWSAVEMLVSAYKSIVDLEMPKKAILGVLYLLSFFVFCYLYYTFLFSSLIETFFPKARNSFRLLRKNTK